MRVNLFPFQKRALADLRQNCAEALGGYHRTHTPKVVSFTAPTGAGKTIIMASLIEDILYGDENYAEQPDAVFIWLSDSPQLNEQSKTKIDTKADRIRFSQTITVADDSFDQEMFDDGHIYFLNTQKLSKTSNLTREGDRNFTIWETLANTAREKGERLYTIIDEAHRGMQGREAGRATTIMQKFLKGSVEDGLPPMPVVIGMSATSERFNKLVEGTSSTIYKSIVTSEDVRSSGLLKDRIIITYPEEKTVNKDMAVLQAAADNWKEKWEHWHQYCYEQHYAQVNPILVIQVLNGTGGKISDTDLDDCLQKIEERVGFRFKPGQVVHTFGQTSSAIQVSGLDVHYIDASDIADNRNIRVVFFKENLSTGWDCPRAETMMSFRRAADATYIAQLLGRMVRTPMQMRILVDEALNDVHLYLPYFDEETVKEVITALQSTEGGDIPTDIYDEPAGGKHFETLTIKRTPGTPKPKATDPNQLDFMKGGVAPGDAVQETPPTNTQNPSSSAMEECVPANDGNTTDTDKTSDETPKSPAYPTNSTDAVEQNQQPNTATIPEDEVVTDTFDREQVMRFINDAGLLTYHVRSVVISNYLSSLFKLAHCLSQSGLYPSAVKDIASDVVSMIQAHMDALKYAGKYDALVEQVRQFRLSTQIFDVFGESVDNYYVHNLFTTTDTDIDRQFRIADVKLGNEGIGNEYGRRFIDMNNPLAFKIDVIIFASDTECLTRLHSYAETKFHSLNDDYRKYIATVKSETIRRQYDNIVSDGDIVSKHSFRLPETIQVSQDSSGKEYNDHLFVNAETGTARMKLNPWEEGVIAEEERRPDFVCWIRNPSRAHWALCIPYKLDMVDKPTYPDFIVVRKNPVLGYEIDILEPHRPNEKDNLGKAQGFAEYARQNPGLGRIQLIRQESDVTGAVRFKRLDMSKSSVRDKISRAVTNDELDHIFDTDGSFDTV